MSLQTVNWQASFIVTVNSVKKKMWSSGRVLAFVSVKVSSSAFKSQMSFFFNEPTTDRFL
jgi:hypothetical protein